MGIPPLELPPREWSKNWYAVMCPPKKLKKSEQGFTSVCHVLLKQPLFSGGKYLKQNAQNQSGLTWPFCYQISKKTIEIARFLMLRFQCITKNIPRRMLFKVLMIMIFIDPLRESCIGSLGRSLPFYYK